MKKRLLLMVMLVICLTLFAGCSSTCKVEGCENTPVEKAKYCTVHICAEQDCVNAKVGTNYCDTHYACSVENCTGERLLDGEYCATHDKYAKVQEFGQALDSLINAWS